MRALTISERSGGKAPLFDARAAFSLANGATNVSDSRAGRKNISPNSSGPSSTSYSGSGSGCGSSEASIQPAATRAWLLLIFFLVATEYHQEERELDVVLPEVVQAQPLAMTKELIVNITKAGVFKIGGRYGIEGKLIEDDPRIGSVTTHPHPSRNPIAYF